MKNLLASLLATFLVVGTATGQEDYNPQDPKAKEILENLSAKNKKYTSIKANFEYRMQNEAADIDETQKGIVWLKGDKYRVELDGVERVSDGKTNYTYLTEEEELQITSAENEEEGGMMKPSEIMNIHEQGFKYKYIGTKTIDVKTLEYIELYPEKADKPFHTIELYIDKAKTQIYMIKVKSKNGNTFTYKLDNYQTNMTIPDSKFNFDKSKAGDVIDLR